MIMRKLKLLTTALVLLAISAPAFAATRNPNRAADAYARGAYEGNSTFPTPPQGTWRGNYDPSYGVPYPGRPYGAPDGW
jgi:hypothetical protein